MRRWCLLFCLFAKLIATNASTAGPPFAPFRYPTVYGPTGRPYGPTQAHYQYQRRYGRPWHGMGGRTAFLPAGGSQFLFQSPSLRGGFGLPYYGPYFYRPPAFVSGFNYFVTPSIGVQISPFYSQPFAGVFPSVAPFDVPGSGVLASSTQQNFWAPTVVQPQLKSKAPADQNRAAKHRAVTQTTNRPVEKSTVEAKLRSLRVQARGDVAMRRQEYSRAYLRYKSAIIHAGDRPELYFRQALALIAIGQYDRAVRQLVRAIEIDANWPQNKTSLDEVFGPDHQIEKTRIIEKAAAWTKRDIHDADRLFLMGVLLHFDKDRDRSVPFFVAAQKLVGNAPHIDSFLASSDSDQSQRADDRQKVDKRETPDFPDAPVDPDPLGPLLNPPKR